MVDTADFLSPKHILLDLRPTSRRQLFREIGELCADVPGLDADRVRDALMEREKLGSTAVGGGIAIPHAKIEGLDHIVGGFLRLARPLEFEALDEEPVDLVFFILAPAAASAEHLKALARISRLLRDPKLRARLRKEGDIGRIHKLLTGRAESHAA